MLATSKNVLLPGHNQLLTTVTDDQTLWLSAEHEQMILFVDIFQIPKLKRSHCPLLQHSIWESQTPWAYRCELFSRKLEQSVNAQDQCTQRNTFTTTTKQMIKYCIHTQKFVTWGSHLNRLKLKFTYKKILQIIHYIITHLTLTVPVTTIDALWHFETG